jgi:hypothetical protein
MSEENTNKQSSRWKTITNIGGVVMLICWAGLAVGAIWFILKAILMSAVGLVMQLNQGPYNHMTYHESVDWMNMMFGLATDILPPVGLAIPFGAVVAIVMFAIPAAIIGVVWLLTAVIKGILNK